MGSRRDSRTAYVDAHVGNRLRERRILLGMSQTRLGESLGLSFQQIQKYERGIDRISVGRLVHMSEVLDVPTERVNQALRATRGPISLETPIGEEEDASLSDFIEDRDATSPEDAVIGTSLAEQTRRVLTTLTPRDCDNLAEARA